MSTDQPAGDHIGTPTESMSMSDRVAAQFGLTQAEPEQPEAATAPNPEETEVPAEETAAPAEEFVEFEHEGQTYQVPKALEPALMRQKDYTQKTQTVAERQRQFEALQEQGRVASVRNAFEVQMAPKVDLLKQYDMVLNQRPNFEGMTDRDIMLTREQRETWKEERARLASDLTVEYQKYTHEQEGAIAQAKSKTLEAVAKSIPDFKPDTLKSIREHAKQDGYTDVELSAIETDPRHILTLNKAMQYDKLMASKAQAVQTATKAPPMVKPGSTRPMPQGVKNDLALRKAQSAATNSADRAKIIQQRLEGRF